jgi:hypothetical protein
MKMKLIEGSETSAYTNQTPGNYPKENLLYHKYCFASHKLCSLAYSDWGFIKSCNI